MNLQVLALLVGIMALSSADALSCHDCVASGGISCLYERFPRCYPNIHVAICDIDSPPTDVCAAVVVGGGAWYNPASYLGYGRSKDLESPVPGSPLPTPCYVSHAGENHDGLDCDGNGQDAESDYLHSYPYLGDERHVNTNYVKGLVVAPVRRGVRRV